MSKALVIATVAVTSIVSVLVFVSSSFAGAIELTPPAGLDFSMKGATAKEVITARNIGKGDVDMDDEYIEEGGVKNETNFKIVGAGGMEACALPGAKVPFEELAEGAKCGIGVEFVTGAKPKAAVYVLEYGNILCPNMETLPVKS